MIKIRPAQLSDCELLWQWSNAPDVRKSSFHSEPIPLDEHKQWFSSKLQDPDCTIYIVEDENSEPLGQVRYQVIDKGKAAEVSISISSAVRGKGIAAGALKMTALKYRNERKVDELHAFIKIENHTSVRAFERAGYLLQEKCSREGQAAHKLVLKLPGSNHFA